MKLRYLLILLVFVAGCFGCADSKPVEKVDYEFICTSCFLDNGNRGYGFFYNYNYDTSEIPHPTPCFPCTSKPPANVLEKIGTLVCKDLLMNRRVSRIHMRHQGPGGNYIYEHYLLANVWDDMMHPERNGLSEQEFKDEMALEDKKYWAKIAKDEAEYVKSMEGKDPYLEAQKEKSNEDLVMKQLHKKIEASIDRDQYNLEKRLDELDSRLDPAAGSPF